MKFAIGKISSKGQIVIPQNMRTDLNKGDEFLIIKDKDKIVMKKMQSVAKSLKEDLEFAKRTEEAWKRHEKGEFISMNKDDF